MKAILGAGVFFFLLGLGVGAGARAGPSQCLRYASLHSKLRCERDHYLTEFGYKYCNLFERELNEFTEPERQILSKIKLCLIERLEGEPDLTCENARPLALAHHVSCYLENGFCRLSLTARVRVYFPLASELLEPDFFEVARAIRRGCGFAVFRSPPSGA